MHKIEFSFYHELRLIWPWAATNFTYLNFWIEFYIHKLSSKPTLFLCWHLIQRHSHCRLVERTDPHHLPVPQPLPQLTGSTSPDSSTALVSHEPQITSYSTQITVNKQLRTSAPPSADRYYLTRLFNCPNLSRTSDNFLQHTNYSK